MKTDSWTRAHHTPDLQARTNTLDYLKQRRESVQNVAFIILCLLFVFSSLFRGAGFQSTWLRWLVYSLPAIGGYFVLSLATRHSRSFLRPDIYKRFLRPHFLLFSGLVLETLLFHSQTALGMSRYIEEVVFILSPIVFAIMLYALFNPQRGEAAIYWLLLSAAIAGFLLEKGDDLLLAVSQLSDLSRAFSTSSFSTESHSYTFALGFLIIYLFGRKRWIPAGISLVFFILGFKRIGYGALGAGLAAYLMALAVSKYWKSISRVIPIAVVVMNLAVVYVLFQFARGTYDNFIMQNLGQSGDYFSQGREKLWRNLSIGLGVDWDTTPTTGLGLGVASDYLIKIDYRLINVHSDLLKLFIESGWVAFAIFLYVFYRLGSFSPLAFALTVYMNVNWVTDNTFVYFQVMATYFILMGSAIIYTQRSDPSIAPEEPPRRLAKWAKYSAHRANGSETSGG
jgi:hypothetical protein